MLAAGCTIASSKPADAVDRLVIVASASTVFVLVPEWHHYQIEQQAACAVVLVAIVVGSRSGVARGSGQLHQIQQQAGAVFLFG